MSVESYSSHHIIWQLDDLFSHFQFFEQPIFVYYSKVWKIWIHKFKKCTYSSHPYQVQQLLADWASWGWPAWLRGTWLQSPRWVWRPYAFVERSRIPYVTKIDMIEGTEKDLHFPSYFSKVHVFWEGFKESSIFFYLLCNVQ